MQRDEPHEVPVAKGERSDLLTQAHAVDAGLSVWCLDVVDGFPVKPLRGVDIRPVELLDSIETGRDLQQGNAVQTQKHAEKLRGIQVEANTLRWLLRHSALPLLSTLRLGDDRSQVGFLRRIRRRPREASFDARLVRLA